MRGSRRRTRDRWRIIVWSEFKGGGWYWRLYRYTDGSVMEFDTEEEAREALHMLRAHRVPGRFRVHHGALTSVQVEAQGHRLRPPADLLLRMQAAKGAA